MFEHRLNDYQGHKRWDKNLTSGLENIRRLAHETILPALDRCSIILSRFSGIAQFRGSAEDVGFSHQEITRIQDTVASLHLSVARILSLVADELECFAVFSVWLRQEIDRHASESSESLSDEHAEKQAQIDYSKILRYLQTSMTNSALEAYLAPTQSDQDDAMWRESTDGVVLFDLVDRNIQNQEKGTEFKRHVLRLDLMCKHLSRQCAAVFQQIAESEKRNVHLGSPVYIGTTATAGLFDSIMIPGVS